MTDDAFVKTLEQETAKQAAMLNGDPDPMINYWADSDDITLFGGWGPRRVSERLCQGVIEISVSAVTWGDLNVGRSK
jgi:hypothetical protein